MFHNTPIRSFLGLLAAAAFLSMGPMARLSSAQEMGAAGGAEVEQTLEQIHITPEEVKTGELPLAEKIRQAVSTTPGGFKAEVPEEVYGYPQLSGLASREPLLAGPVDPEYRIGPNDKIVVNMWGKKTQQFELTVDDRGFVSFQLTSSETTQPQTTILQARFSVNGVRFKDLRRQILLELSKLTSDINPLNPDASPTLVDVTLGEIRGINVMVMGEVARPSQYALKATVASIFNVLAVAGSITRAGSLRELSIRRPDGRIDKVDLYEVLLFNELTSPTTSQDKYYLREGDILTVPLRKRAVRIQGLVKRPGFYELRENENLRQMIEIAGGIQPTGDPRNIKVMRSILEKTTYFDVDLEKTSNFILYDGDVIQVVEKAKTRRKNFVEITGDGVRQPGAYEYQDGMTIADLVARAGGFYEDAILDNAVFVRTNNDYSLSFSSINLDSVLKDSSVAAFPLNPMDKLIVYAKFFTLGGEKYVSIQGHVKQPGKVSLSANMTLHDLIFMTGGFADQDFLKETYLERGDIVRKEFGAEVNIPFNLGKLLQGDPAENHPLQSEDVVKVYIVTDVVGEKKVSVSGHVKHRGTYRMIENMRLRDLLFLAGGFDDPDFLKQTYLERADISRIDTLTHQKLIVSANLRKVLEGDAAQNLALQSLDELHVYALDELRDVLTVRIEGEVRSPGTYPLADKMTLADLLSLANGLTDNADPELIEIARFPTPDAFEKDSAQRIATSIEQAGSIVLTPNDRVVVRRRAERRDKGSVSVSGEVAYPGVYVLLSQTETLSDIVDRTGGFIQGAAPAAATLTRKHSGKVSIDMVEALKDRHGSYDIILVDGDQIDVPKENWMVEIAGEVVFPQSVQYVKGASVSDYLARCAGRTENSSMRDSVIIYPNGEARKARRGLWPFHFYREVTPGCRIVVANKKGILSIGEKQVGKKIEEESSETGSKQEQGNLKVEEGGVQAPVNVEPLAASQPAPAASQPATPASLPAGAPRL